VEPELELEPAQVVVVEAVVPAAPAQPGATPAALEQVPRGREHRVVEIEEVRLP
jgi:hypothetical protein